MDQVHTKSMDALQPYIRLADGSSPKSPRFAAELIAGVTAASNIYVFEDLLQRRSIQALRSPDTPAEFQGYLTMLEIFAWGTWQDYQKTPNLPTLNEKQARKLRLLTLLTLSATTKPLTYSFLMESLSLTAPSDLEALVTTAIYSSLITARLSPATNPPVVNVTSVAPLRDVKLESLPSMISTLTQWENRCCAVISDIEAEIAKIRTESAKRRAREHDRQVLVEKTVANFIASEGGDAAGSGSGSKKAGWHPRDIAAGLRGRGGGGHGNKREFDDGYWDDESQRFDHHGSGMDIDDGPPGPRSAGSRHAKRVLGKKS